MAGGSVGGQEPSALRQNAKQMASSCRWWCTLKYADCDHLLRMLSNETWLLALDWILRFRTGRHHAFGGALWMPSSEGVHSLVTLELVHCIFTTAPLYRRTLDKPFEEIALTPLYLIPYTLYPYPPISPSYPSKYTQTPPSNSTCPHTAPYNTD